MNFTSGRILRQVRKCVYLLCIGAVLVNIRSIFTDFDTDSEYALVTSWRMLTGDHMFAEMWEPHQTSAFLVTFFMWIYIAVTKTTTGIVLFLHGIGVLMYGAITVSLYKELKKWINPSLAMLMCVFFFSVRPKNRVFLEFSNMLIGFSALLFLSLLRFFADQYKTRWLILASVSLCLQILSYPSCLIVYFVVIVLLGIYTDNCIKHIVRFSLCCFLQGMCYICYFIWRLGVSDFLSGLKNIVSADGSHNGLATDGEGYFMFLGQSCLWILCCFIFAGLVSGLLYIFKKVRVKNTLPLICSVAILLSNLVREIVYKQIYSYVIIYVPFILFGMLGVRYCSKVEKRVYFTGLFLSIGSTLATFLLTNLGVMFILPYLILAVMVSFLPVSKWLEVNGTFTNLLFKWNVLFLFCGMIVLHRGIATQSMNGSSFTIFDLTGIVKSGPAAGIVTDYMGAYEVQCNIEDWDMFIESGDRLLMVAGDLLNSMAYMYQDVTISAQSTICTPTYDEKLLEYWEEYPDKFPNVIAVNCWYGELRIDEESWIYKWIQEEFQPNAYVDGRYWRFYRLSE